MYIQGVWMAKLQWKRCAVRNFNSRIRQEIEKMDVTGYGNIIIQAGGNDAANERNIDSVKEDLVRIVCDVKSRSPSTTVYISEVTPRYDADVWEVNNTAWEVCHEYDAKFIETKFHVNPYHFEWDHIHLSFKGTAKLLKIHNSQQLYPYSKETWRRNTVLHLWWKGTQRAQMSTRRADRVLSLRTSWSQVQVLRILDIFSVARTAYSDTDSIRKLPYYILTL